MPGSGAGLNRIQSHLVPDVTGTVAYDSGIMMCEAKNWTKWTFTAEGTFTGVSIYIYGFVNPNLTAVFWGQSGNNPYGSNYTGGPGSLAGTATALFTASPTTPPGPYFLIAANADQSGTGIDINPITGAGQQCSSNRALHGVRVVMISDSGTGTVGLWGTASP